MLSLFIFLRYIAFACFILFNSVICVIAALNLGSLNADVPKFPQIDTYLIFTGALTIAFVFPVIFIELFRRDAFICRVAVEIAWVAIFWIMALSGAAAITAVSPHACVLPPPPLPPSFSPAPRSLASDLKFTCTTSTQALTAFTWLSNITFLTYLIGLTICAVYHSQEDSHVWQRGVRSFRWFSPTKPPANPPRAAFSYGKIVDPREPLQAPRVYSQQMALPRSYVAEPLQVHPSPQGPVFIPQEQPRHQQHHHHHHHHQPPQQSNGLRRDFKFPAEPMPVATGPPALHINTSFDPPAPPPIAVTSEKSNTYPSLYPQFVRASGGKLAQPPPHDGPTPPPLGGWPRSNTLEPPPQIKPRPLPTPRNSAQASPSTTGPQPQRSASQEMATVRPLPPVTRMQRPAGPRSSSVDRHRPPPLDLSRISSTRPS